MCWQDGCGVEKPKPAEQQQTFRLISAWSEPYHWETRRLLLLAGRKLFTSNSPLTLQPAFTCLISHCSRSQKRNVLFILIASPLLYVPPLFFRLDLPQRLQGCFALLCVTICCCCWDGHVILLLTVVRTGAFAAQDAGAQQLLPLIWRADVSVGLIISWETDLLASYILQVVVSYRPQNEKKKKKCNSGVSQWKRECIWTAAIVASQQNIDCYYGITGELYCAQRAHATNKKAPEGLDEDLRCDVMRSRRSKTNVRVK